MFVWLSASALSSMLPAQIPPSDGPAVAMQLAFGVDPATVLGVAGVREAQLFLKPEGFRVAAPAPLLTPLLDLSVAAMFGAFMAPPYPDVDAISLGTDLIPADCAGVVTIPPGHWNFNVFSVRRGTVGVAGGAINLEVGTPGGNEADFFHYVYRGSSCIPPEFIGRTFKLADSSDYGLPLVAEVDAVDLGLPLFLLQATLAPSLGLPVCPTCPTVYFSFEGSVANLARVPPGWFGVGPPSGAAVFASTWNGLVWSVPAVAFTPLALGLTPCEDLDALAVDAYDPTGLQLLYSTRAGGCVLRDELLFFQPSCPTSAIAAIPLRYMDGTRVARDMGIDLGDDVDGICVGDPICQGNRSGQSGEIQLERTLAQPFAQSLTFGFPRGLALQALRDRTPPQNGFGYTLITVNGHRGGAGALLVTVPAAYPFVFPLQISFQVPISSPFAGAPVSLRLVLPPSMLGADLILQAATLPASPPLNLRISHALRLLAH